MTKLKILLSFDHELSLGGAESYARNLFEPTDHLIQLASEIEAPITLFSDVCCAIRFREWDRDGFFHRYERQLDHAIRHGHDVQLHIHPHWFDSTYRDGRFEPAHSYSLGSFHDREWPLSIGGIVCQSMELLTELCQASTQYQCVAYRAGGFSLEPNTAAILTTLHDRGIRIESTIAAGFRYDSELWSVDFSDMPSESNWWIAPDGPLNQMADHGLYEIPIATRPRTPWNNLPFLFKRITKRSRRYDSGGWPIESGHVGVWNKLGRLFPRSAWMLGFDHFADDVGDLMATLHHHVAKTHHQDVIACSAISHPKFMGKHARHLMRQFVQQVRTEYGSAVEFCTYQQFYESHLQGHAPAVESAGQTEKASVG